MKEGTDILIVIDRNYSPNRTISIATNSENELKELAALFLTNGAEHIYKKIARIDSERDDFVEEKIKRDNINVHFYEDEEVNDESTLMVVTSKDELIEAEDFLIKDYFGWGTKNS